MRSTGKLLESAENFNTPTDRILIRWKSKSPDLSPRPFPRNHSIKEVGRNSGILVGASDLSTPRGSRPVFDFLILIPNAVSPSTEWKAE